MYNNVHEQSTQLILLECNSSNNVDDDDDDDGDDVIGDDGDNDKLMNLSIAVNLIRLQPNIT